MKDRMDWVVLYLNRATFALGNIARLKGGEEPLERVPGT